MNDSHVLIVDNQESFAVHLGCSFRNLGFPVWLSTDLSQARCTAELAPPRLIISELRMDGKWVFDFAPTLWRQAAATPIVVVTAYPSVATAVQAIRCGFAGYVAKPATAQAILDLVDESNAGHATSAPETTTTWPSLNRTMWEYINQVFVASGTMTEAARRLGIDRRSLRRMLTKYPPAR